MSFNRDNITWQDATGRWSIGFYAATVTDPDGDPEWDVDYDYDRFEWVSTGHADPRRRLPGVHLPPCEPGRHQHRPLREKTAQAP